MSAKGLLKFSVVMGVMTLIGVSAVQQNTGKPINVPSLQGSTSPNEEPVRDNPAAQKASALAKLKILSLDWEASAGGNIMIASFVIENTNSFDVKDLSIECVHYAESGTRIDSNKRTVYKVFSAKAKTRINKFNMGFIHSQAASSSCSISSFQPI